MIKTPLTLVVILFISLTASAQSADTTANKNDPLKVFTKTEKEARFPGGPQGWRKYLEANLNADLAGNVLS